MEQQKNRYSKWDSRSMKQKLAEYGIHIPFGLRNLTYEQVLELHTLSYKEQVYLARMIRNDRKKARELGVRNHGNKQADVLRGRIFLADLNDTRASEQRGIRPVVILQNDLGNERSTTTIVAPITTKAEKKANMITHIPFHNIEDDIDVMILLEQVTTIDKVRILCYMGEVPDDVMQQVEKALRHSLGLNKSRKKQKCLERLYTFGCLAISKIDHNENGGDAMTVVRYVNDELIDGKLPPMMVENPALIQIIRDVQLKCIENEKNKDNEMCESQIRTFVFYK